MFSAERNGLAYCNWLAIWAVSAVSFCLCLFSAACEASPIESRWSPSVVSCQYLIDLHLVQCNYWFNLGEADQQEEESLIAWAITEEDSSICTASVSLFFFCHVTEIIDQSRRLGVVQGTMWEELFLWIQSFFWMHFGNPEQLDPCVPHCPLFFLLSPCEDPVVLWKIKGSSFGRLEMLV